MKPIIEVEALSKLYRVGARSGRSIRDSMEGFFRKIGWQKDPEWSHHKKHQTPMVEFSPQQRGAKPNTFWALKDINFTVNEGEVIGIIGRNGAGKSTLLKILSRITEPTSGRAIMRGRVASLLEVGTGFHPDLTGRENVYLNGAILGMRKREIDKKFDEILAFAEVEKFIDTPVKHYSSGMYVRLAFAVAAHLDPEILLVDEVLAVGDAAFQKKCLGKMGAVAKAGRTVLFVSHNMAAVKELCPRTLLLAQGSTQINGESSVVIQKYLDVDIKSQDGTVPADAETVFTGEAKIKRIFCSDYAGHPAHQLYFQDPFTLRAEVEFLTAVPDALMDVSFYSRDGFLISNVISATKGDAQSFKAGLYKIEIKVQNHFQPGQYSLGFGVHRINGATMSYVERIYDFEVAGVSRSGQSYPYSWVNGLMWSHADWRFEGIS